MQFHGFSLCAAVLFVVSTQSIECLQTIFVCAFRRVEECDR